MVMRGKMRAGIGLIFRWESLGTGILLLGMGDKESLLRMGFEWQRMAFVATAM